MIQYVYLTYSLHIKHGLYIQLSDLIPQLDVSRNIQQLFFFFRDWNTHIILSWRFPLPRFFVFFSCCECSGTFFVGTSLLVLHLLGLKGLSKTAVFMLKITVYLLCPFLKNIPLYPKETYVRLGSYQIWANNSTGDCYSSITRWLDNNLCKKRLCYKLVQGFRVTCLLFTRRAINLTLYHSFMYSLVSPN